MKFSEFKGNRNDCWFCYGDRCGHFVVSAPENMTVWELAPKVNDLFPDDIITLEKFTYGVVEEMIDCGEITQEDLNSFDFFIIT